MPPCLLATLRPAIWTSNLGWTNFNYIKWFWENSLPILTEYTELGLQVVSLVPGNGDLKASKSSKLGSVGFGLGWNSVKLSNLVWRKDGPVSSEVWCGRVEFWVFVTKKTCLWLFVPWLVPVWKQWKGTWVLFINSKSCTAQRKLTKNVQLQTSDFQWSSALLSAGLAQLQLASGTKMLCR